MMNDREKQLNRIDDRNAQVDAMTTDTKPSDAALEIARKIHYYESACDLANCEHNVELIRIALLIDAGVREVREALEYVIEHPRAAYGMGDTPHAERCRMQTLAETALRTWRNK